MLKIKLLPAGYGDCILISIDSVENVNILIDGGLSETYDKYLKKEVAHILALNQKLNLVISTHMDNDHISGLVKLLNSSYSKLINEIWYNGLIQVVDSRFYSKEKDEYTKEDIKIIDKIISQGVISDSQQKIGINSGMSLGVLITKNKIALNTITSGKLICDNTLYDRYEIAKNIYISVIGPSIDDIVLLEDQWKKEMVSQNFMFRVNNKIKMTEAFEYQLMRIKSHYSPESYKICGDGDLKKYIGDLSETDGSIVNKSSISFILEYNEKKFLFLGDSVIDERFLSKLKKNVGNQYHFSAIKLPHHGSRFNITHEFIHRYTADEYYCSTNSKKYNHPDLETLAALICENTKFKKIIFNYPIKKALFLDKTQWKNKYNYDIVMGDEKNTIERNFL